MNVREESIHVRQQTNCLWPRHLPQSSLKYHLGTRGVCQNASLLIQVVYSQIYDVSQIGPLCCWQLFLNHQTCSCCWNSEVSRRPRPWCCHWAEVQVQKVGWRWPRMRLPPSVSCSPAAGQKPPHGPEEFSWQWGSLKKLWLLFSYLSVSSLQKAAGFLSNGSICLAFIKKESGN